MAELRGQLLACRWSGPTTCCCYTPKLTGLELQQHHPTSYADEDTAVVEPWPPAAVLHRSRAQCQVVCDPCSSVVHSGCRRPFFFLSPLLYIAKARLWKCKCTPKYSATAARFFARKVELQGQGMKALLFSHAPCSQRSHPPGTHDRPWQ